MKHSQISDQVMQVLSLPQDCITGDLLLSFIGNQTLYVENFRRILYWDYENLEIEGRHVILTVKGRKITVAYLGPDEIKLTGIIEQVMFGGNR
jgi:sporulation protein YqfC